MTAGFGALRLLLAAAAGFLAAALAALALVIAVAGAALGMVTGGAGSGGSGTGSGVGGTTSGATVLPVTGVDGMPAGFALPAGTPTAVVTAVTFADRQLGKPYQWGGAGDPSFDCSGLMQAAYAAAGITISRTTYDQVHDGTAVPDTAALRPGDLVLIPGSGDGGTMSSPGHVGIFIGNDAHGIGYVLQAPYTGTYIQVTPLSEFQPIAALRRIVPS